MKPAVTIRSADVIRDVGKAMNISPKDIVSSGRWAHFVEVRATVAVILKHHGMSNCQIARRLNRNHSSVGHLLRKFDDYTARTPKLRVVADRLMVAA